MPLCLSCGKSEPQGVRVCTRCNGMEFSNFRSSAVGLPKKDSKPTEPDLNLDISAIEEFLKDAPPVNQTPSKDSLKEVKREAKKRKLKKLFSFRRKK
jgi:hypothetical protein